VDSLLDSLLTLENPIVQDLCRCPNGHIYEDHSEYSASFIAGTTVSDTIQDWIDLQCQSGIHRCRECNSFCSQISTYNSPPIISFQLADALTTCDVVISVQQKTGETLWYRLAGIIYFGDNHFVAHIIRKDGQVWFYDGIGTGWNLIYEGSVQSNQLDLLSVSAKSACCAIYCLM